MALGRVGGGAFSLSTDLANIRDDLDPGLVTFAKPWMPICVPSGAVFNRLAVVLGFGAVFPGS